MTREKKIKKLAKELSIRDAGILDIALSDIAKKTIFTKEQTERLENIKKEMNN